jgi:DeoR/GlpR family transcriptional regulator of sugar metabolism
MFAAERRRAILDAVRSNGVMSLHDLADLVSTSEVTVRRDLRYLEAEGLLDRRHGGAVAIGVLSHEPTYSEKSQLAAAEKAAIAERAAECVSDGEAIVIGAGTTTQALARRLVQRRELTVVTNSLLVAQALAAARDVDVVMTGGTLRGSIFALVGHAAERSLAELHTSRAFISGNGLTAQRGLSTPNTLVAGVDMAIAAAAEEVVVLADHTKIGVDTMVQTVPAARIDRLVTDEGADPDELARLRERGVVVDVVSTVDDQDDRSPG